MRIEVIKTFDTCFPSFGSWFYEVEKGLERGYRWKSWFGWKKGFWWKTWKARQLNIYYTHPLLCKWSALLFLFKPSFIIFWTYGSHRLYISSKKGQLQKIWRSAQIKKIKSTPITYHGVYYIFKVVLIFMLSIRNLIFQPNQDFPYFPLSKPFSTS